MKWVSNGIARYVYIKHETDCFEVAVGPDGWILFINMYHNDATLKPRKVDLSDLDQVVQAKICKRLTPSDYSI
jgi:hypothetical protein